MNKKRNFPKKFIFDQRGTALFLSLMILSGIMVGAIGMSELLMANIRIGNVKVKSTKAYFAAEAGTERVLWEYKNGYDPGDFGPPDNSKEDIFSKNLSNGSSYQVNYKEDDDADWNYDKFISIGSYKDVKRTIQTSFRYSK